VTEEWVTIHSELKLNAVARVVKVDPEISNEGKWPLTPGVSVGAKFSDGTNYWKVFQRRWALGLEMHCSAATP
jgi:hypothetical protein